jgi:hypothetical protein
MGALLLQIRSENTIPPIIWSNKKKNFKVQTGGSSHNAHH